MRLPAAALACLLVAAPAAADPELRPFPVEQLRVDSKAPHVFTGGALDIVVEGNVSVTLPPGIEQVELDVTATGPLQVTAAVKPARGPFTPFGPPWRHFVLAPGDSTVPLDFRISSGWVPNAEPVLGLHGSGKLVIRAIRARKTPADLARAFAEFDRANFWAPEGIGHTTINLLTPAYWSESRGSWLSDVVAGVAAGAFAVALAVPFLRRRRRRPALAMAVAALVATGLWNAHLLVRLLPAFHLQPTLDPEERIRDHNWIAPQVGALAALARRTIRPEERVGVIARDQDWFGPETLCFSLAPRPCVFMKRDAPVHHGLQGVGTLRSDEIDAIVVMQGEWMPTGFERVAGLGRPYFIARRAR